MLSLLLTLSLLGAPGESKDLVLDRFDGSTPTDGASAWTPSEGTPPVRQVTEDGQRSLELTVPFGQTESLNRVVIDRRAQLDLTSTGDFKLTLSVADPAAIGNISLYFRSGDGWYSGAGSVQRKGRQTVQFNKVDYRTEGRPAGWDKIDGIRIAFWRGADRDTTIRLLGLAASRYDVALVVPAAADAADRRSEVRAAIESAGRLRAMLADVGIGTDTVEESDLARGALKDKRIAILPHNPGLDAEAVAALAQFVKDGGKLFVCYSLPAALEPVLGIGRTGYVRPEEPGQLAEIRFDAPQIPGLPERVKQASWNIYTAKPLRPDARVIAHWFDEKGQPTDYPALLASPAGVFMTHIVLNDDREAKTRMLAALLGWLDPALWTEMVRGELERAERVGPFEDEAALHAYIKQSNRPEAVALLEKSVKALEQARQRAESNQPAQAIEQARAAREMAVEAYLRAVPSREAEGRGFWEHSGLGAYPGDWERTARELAENGFNFVVPNMLWGGVAHYASDLLPRSEAFEKYGDQIAACVEAAHRHGLEVHVWKVNHNLGRAPREFVDELRQQGRLQVSSSGEPLDWLCPSHPENFKLERDSMLEVARKYPVDGLHFDYIRYPDADHCFCDGCRDRFEAERGQAVANWPADCRRGPLAEEYQDWRCQQITRLVEAVDREAHALRPELKVSAAVFSAYPQCRVSVGQDWAGWVQAGLLDFLCPMDYTNSDFGFAGLVSSQLKRVDGKIPMYPGIGATASSSRLSADRVVGQIQIAREAGAQGFIIFNLSAGTIAEIVPGVGLGASATKAVPPHFKALQPVPRTRGPANETEK